MNPRQQKEEQTCRQFPEEVLCAVCGAASLLVSISADGMLSRTVTASYECDVGHRSHTINAGLTVWVEDNRTKHERRLYELLEGKADKQIEARLRGYDRRLRALEGQWDRGAR